MWIFLDFIVNFVTSCARQTICTEYIPKEKEGIASQDLFSSSTSKQTSFIDFARLEVFFFKLKLPLALVCGHCYFRSILGLKKEKSKWERLKCPHSLSSIDSLQSFAGHKERAARASVSCIWRARQATVSCGGRLHEHQAGVLGNTLARASGLHGQQMGRRGIRRGVRILYSSEQNEESCSNNYSKNKRRGTALCINIVSNQCCTAPRCTVAHPRHCTSIL
jgi:hypothetical protein